MRQILMILAVTAAVVGISAASVAQNAGYVVVNNNLYPDNSVSGFRVDTAGAMKLVKTISTGGEGSTGNFGEPTIAVGRNARCMFVSDAESNDVAAFKGPNFSQPVSRFSNPQLTGEQFGTSLAIDPAGRFLYTAWSGSQNVAVLAIASDCSLSLVGSPLKQPDMVDGITVTRDGKVLVVAYPNTGGAQAYRTSAKGMLRALGPELVFRDAIADCATVGCYPSAQDVTNDDVYWVWGNLAGSVASSLTATLTPNGFVNAALQTYPDSTVLNVVAPLFSPAAAATDSGNLYLAATGAYGPFIPGGFLVTTFSQGTINYQSYVANGVAFFTGALQTIGTTGSGSPLVQLGDDISGNLSLYSYTIDGTAVTAVGTSADPMGDDYGFSTAAFPPRP